jgi:DsrE/DsrF-like family
MSSTKTAIVVLSDPNGGEEALGRLFNALAATYDFKQKRQDVQLLFQGTGTRWAGLLTKTDHPAHALYKAIEDKVAGVSTACSVVFGAREDAERNGFSLLTGNPVPNTAGLPSLESYASQGYTILTF